MKYVFCIAASFLFAGNSSQEVVTMSVATINTLQISGGSPNLVISSSSNGQLDPAEDSSTSYGILTNDGNAKKIAVAIDQEMPTDTTLSLLLQAPTSATSRGSLDLSVSSQDFVTNIPAYSSQSNLAISYQFSAEPTASIGSFSRTVTFTLTNQ